MAAFYTLLYIASAEDAEALAIEEDPQDRWPSLWLKHIGDLELVALWDLLTKEPSGSAGTLMEDLLFQASDEGPFVMGVPPEFVAAVAAISDRDAAKVASAWGETDELADWQQKDLERTLNELRQFARQAVASNCPVLQVADL
jgi:hypothetical protein